MRNLLFSSLILMTFNVIGQVAPPAPPMPPQFERPDFIVAVQMGTDTLRKEEDSVRLTDQTVEEMKQAMANPNYTVIFTPRGDCGQINLVKTSATSFIIKQQKGSSSKAIFDYIVYAKQKRPMMPMRPHPMPPQPPKAPGQ